MFRLRLWLKIRFTTIWVVYWSGIPVKRPFTSLETKNLPERFTFLVWAKKERVSLQEIERRWNLQGWKKIAEETGKIMIKSAYRWNNYTKFRKWITKEEFVYFRSTIDTSRSKTRRIQCFIYIFVKMFLVSTFAKKVIAKFHVSRLGLHWASRYVLLSDF